MTQKIILIGNYLPDRLESMNRYADYLKELIMKSGGEATIWRPVVFFGQSRNTTRGLGKWLGYGDKYLLAPIWFRWQWAKIKWSNQSLPLVHITDQANTIYSGYFPDAKIIITVHDCIAIRKSLGDFKAVKTSWTGRWQQRWIMAALSKAVHPVFVSMATRIDFSRLSGRSAVIHPVIPNPLYKNWQYVEKDQAWQRFSQAGLDVPTCYIFHHGNASWYKNREMVLAVFEKVHRKHPHCKLVLSSGRLNEEQHHWVVKHGLAEAVIQTGFVSHDVLEALYSQAEVFLFPSWSEGFGWPPLEAQACGCPVVASTGGALPEVLSDSALCTAPDDEEGLTQFVLSVLENKNQRERLVEAGKTNVRRFDPETIGAAYLNMYRSCGYCV